MIEWIALGLSLLNMAWTTTDVISSQKANARDMKEKVTQQAINDFKFSHKTDANPNPVDSISCKNDTVWYYKKGELVGSTVTTIHK